jgi:hypothetical protein
MSHVLLSLVDTVREVRKAVVQDPSSVERRQPRVVLLEERPAPGAAVRPGDKAAPEASSPGKKNPAADGGTGAEGGPEPEGGGRRRMRLGVSVPPEIMSVSLDKLLDRVERFAVKEGPRLWEDSRKKGKEDHFRKAVCRLKRLTLSAAGSYEGDREGKPVEETRIRQALIGLAGKLGEAERIALDREGKAGEPSECP